MKQLMLAAALALTACAGPTETVAQHACQEEKDATRAERGAPEEIEKFRSDGYNTDSWWYWSQGFEITFAWGRHVDTYGRCDTSTYEFEPIR